MKAKLILASSIVVFLATGCASGLNSMQKREYEAFKNNDVLIEEKNPSNGIALGLLPGGGSFYVREPGYGIVNLLFWPLSVLWDPISGYEGSLAINYDITRHKLKQDEKKEISRLDDRLTTGEIDNTEYVLLKRKIQDKYDYQ